MVVKPADHSHPPLPIALALIKSSPEYSFICLLLPVTQPQIFAMPVFPYSPSWFIIALSLVTAYALPEAGEGPRPLTITSESMAATFGEALEGRDLQRRQNTICGWVSGNMGKDNFHA